MGLKEGTIKKVAKGAIITAQVASLLTFSPNPDSNGKKLDALGHVAERQIEKDKQTQEAEMKAKKESPWGIPN